MRDLDEFRFDLDLLGSGDVGLFHQRIHQLEILFGISHNQPAALREEIGARPGRKRNALILQEIERGLAGNQLLATGGLLGVSAGSCTSTHSRGRAVERICADVDRTADETGRHPIFLGEKIAALLVDRDDRDGVGLHLHLQSRLARDVAERFA